MRLLFANRTLKTGPSQTKVPFICVSVPEKQKQADCRKHPNLLVVGEAAHDGGVDDAAEHHGQRVDGERAVARLLLHQVAQLLVGHLHGLDGVLQRTDLLLRSQTEARRSVFSRLHSETDSVSATAAAPHH